MNADIREQVVNIQQELRKFIGTCISEKSLVEISSIISNDLSTFLNDNSNNIIVVCTKNGWIQESKVNFLKLYQKTLEYSQDIREQSSGQIAITTAEIYSLLDVLVYYLSISKEDLLTTPLLPHVPFEQQVTSISSLIKPAIAMRTSTVIFVVILLFIIIVIIRSV